jgi:hypothetical protein
MYVARPGSDPAMIRYPIRCECGHESQCGAGAAGCMWRCTACGRGALIPRLSLLRQSAKGMVLPDLPKRPFQYTLRALLLLLLFAAVLFALAYYAGMSFADLVYGMTLVFAWWFLVKLVRRFRAAMCEAWDVIDRRRGPDHD